MASVFGNSKMQFVRLVLYYVILVIVGAFIRAMWPGVYEMFQGAEVGIGAGAGFLSDVAVEPTGPLTEPYPTLATALVIIGAFTVMLPVAWVYMMTKRSEGYDRSVVQTLIALPTAICGVVVIVQNSFALAFALAGIVAAVRFRNTLKDTKDAVYIFLAIGVGLAAGVQHVAVALVVSVLFNLTILGLWLTNFGNVYANQVGGTGPGASPGPGAPPSPFHEKLQATEGLGKNKRPNAVLTIRTTDLTTAQPMVEAILEADAKVWDWVETRDEDDENSTIEYLVRAKKSIPPSTLVDKLEGHCAPHLDGVEYRPLQGME